jgi:capsular exopolysaccharide synthesis family protein
VNNTQKQRIDESFGQEFRAMLKVLREKAWVVVLCILTAGLAGVAYIAWSPKIYRAQAVILVEQEQPKVVKIEDVESEDLKAAESLKTIEQSLTGANLLLGLIDRNELRQDPAFLPTLKRPATDKQLVEALGRQLSARIRYGTRLIDITVDDRSPVMAEKIAESLIREFILEDGERHLKISKLANSFLVQQAEALKAKLVKSEAALQAYREQNRGVPLEATQNIVVAKLGELNHMVMEAKGARLKLEGDYQQMRKLRNGPPTALLAIPSIASSPTVEALEKGIAEKAGEVAALTEIYKHPLHTGAIKQLHQLKADLDRNVLKAAEVLASAYESAAATEQKIEEALQKQEKAALELNKVSIAYSVLLREVETDRALWESVLARLKETGVTSSVEQDAIRIVSRPVLPDQPVWPAKGRILLISVLCGTALGCGLPLVLRTLDDSFRTPDEVERRFGMPVLGVIPKALHVKSRADCLVLVKQRGSGAAESFRTLRVSLFLLRKDELCKTFLFTSAVRLEGKSFCAINSAAAFAQQGLKTLLIDADLRLPSIGKTFFDGASVEGLTDILEYQTSLENAARPTGIDKLFVLCAGSQLSTPAELLAGEAFGRLIKKAMAKFDRVVVNSAPVQAVSDSLLLAGHVQAICFVVSAHTSAEIISRAVRKLRDACSTPIGFVFNRVSARYDAKYGRQYSQKACARANAGSRNRLIEPPLQLPGSLTT